MIVPGPNVTLISAMRLPKQVGLDIQPSASGVQQSGVGKKKLGHCQQHLVEEREAQLCDDENDEDLQACFHEHAHQMSSRKAQERDQQCITCSRIVNTAYQKT